VHTVESARQRPPWAALCALLFALAACLGACTASDAPRDIRGKVVVPGVNHLGTYGRWAFAELTEIYRIEADFEAKVAAELNRMIESARS